jgi:sec-independent protein translocase protein TatB
MLGVSPLELAMIVVIGLIIFGPDRLPKYAAEAAKFVRDLRRMASSARQDLTAALGNEMPDLDLGDLNPTTFLKGNVLDLLDDTTAPTNGNGSNGARTRGPRGASGGPSEAVSAGPGGDDAPDVTSVHPGEPTGGAGSGDSRPSAGYDADTT